MKSIKHLVLFISFFSSYEICKGQNCKGQLTYSPQASLTVGGATYYNNNPANPKSIPDITLPLGVTTLTSVLTVSQAVNCVSVVSPTPPATVCPSSKTDIRIQNPTNSPASGSYVNGTSNILSYSGGLQPGLNTITVYVDCQSGVTSGQNGQVTAMAAFTVNVLQTVNNPFAATITNECHYTVSGPKHTANYTGKKIFKVTLTSLPPAGTSISILKKNANNTYSTLQTKPFSSLSTSTPIQFDNGGQGYSTGTYQIKFVNNSTELFPTGITSTYTYNFHFRNADCMIRKDYKIIHKHQ